MKYQKEDRVELKRLEWGGEPFQMEILEAKTYKKNKLIMKENTQSEIVPFLCQKLSSLIPNVYDLNYEKQSSNTRSWPKDMRSHHLVKS